MAIHSDSFELSQGTQANGTFERSEQHVAKFRNGRPGFENIAASRNESFRTTFAAEQAEMSRITADAAISDVSTLYSGGIDSDLKVGKYRQYFRLRHPRESFV